MDQPMPVLQVAAPRAGSAGEAAVKTEPSRSISSLWIIRVLALGIGVLGLVIALQRKNRVAMALTAICLLVGVGSFATGMGTGSRVEAQAESPSEVVADSSSISPVELGRQLFIAKGCITCHANRKISNSSAFWTIDMGATDLSNFSANAEVLFLRLKDPASVKSDTQMPNLELRKEEIEALVAFINSK
jgi:mono/diheme cytochrome c family protein